MSTSGSTGFRGLLPRLAFRLLTASLLLVATGSMAGVSGDSHYVEAGFFDVHYCNWPDRPPFYLALFSTARYGDLSAVDVVLPDGRSLGSLPLDRYRVIERPGKPEKRVFMRELEVPEGARDGWFEAHVRLRDDSEQTARDYVIHQVMPRAEGLQPPPGEEDLPLPTQLSWEPVPGAMYYQVYIRDLWQDGKTTYESSLLEEPFVKLPPRLLEPGGFYSWKVHARDVNEHAYLGDFNNGSLTPWVQFSVAPY